jgi:hypothetical protein
MRKNYRIRAFTVSQASGKMHDLLQIARRRSKNARGAMTESVGRIVRIITTERPSPGSVTVMKAD